MVLGTAIAFLSSWVLLGVGDPSSTSSLQRESRVVAENMMVSRPGRGSTARLGRVSARTFDRKILSSDAPVLVSFTARWCAACRTQAKNLQAARKELGGGFRTASLDVDVAPEIASRYGVDALPAMILFEAGEVDWRSRGLRSASSLTSSLRGRILTAAANGP